VKGPSEKRDSQVLHVHLCHYWWCSSSFTLYIYLGADIFGVSVTQADKNTILYYSFFLLIYEGMTIDLLLGEGLQEASDLADSSLLRASVSPCSFSGSKTTTGSSYEIYRLSWSKN